MKFYIFAITLAVCALLAHGMPIEDEEVVPEGRALRHRRVTCDLLSGSVAGVSLNHSACAAHCLALRKKGGACSNGVCICRN